MASRKSLNSYFPPAILALFLSVGAPVFAVDWGPPPPAPGLHLEPVSGDREQFECRFTENQISLLEKLNRCERAVLEKLDIIVVPEFWNVDESYYSPLPLEQKSDSVQPKSLIVSKPLQAFGAYEEGRLVRWGPVSTGAKATPTPGGTFALNWKSRGHRSTVNRDWFLPWYFNFNNRSGHSFHQYSLPGAPASHGCVRLLARDATWLYQWGDEWALDTRGWNVLAEGTPVVIAGEYDFDKPAPWRDPAFLAAGGRLPAEALDLPETATALAQADVSQSANETAWVE